MVRVVPLNLIMQTADALEVAIGKAFRELRAYDDHDKPHQHVKFLQVYELGGQLMGMYWCAPINGQLEQPTRLEVQTPLDLTSTK